MVDAPRQGEGVVDDVAGGDMPRVNDNPSGKLRRPGELRADSLWRRARRSQTSTAAGT